MIPGWKGGHAYAQIDVYRKGKAPLHLQDYALNISLSKDISQPAGMFEIQCAYTPTVARRSTPVDWMTLIYGNPQNGDCLLPNDYVEIRLATHRRAKPYIMRGLLDNAHFSETVSEEGTQRVVILNGRDYGKLFDQYQITYSDNATDYARQITGDALQQWLGNVGISLQNWGARRFFIAIAEAMRAKHLNILRAYNPSMSDLAHKVTVPVYYGVNLYSLNTYTGSLDDLLRSQMSPPWGEYFIRDDPDQPRLHYRIAPFIDLSGTYAWDEARLGDTRYVGFDAGDISESDMSRSDNEVYTWFSTVPQAGSLNLTGDGIVGVNVLAGHRHDNPYFDGAGSPNRVERARRYGFRPLEIESPWIIGLRGRRDFQAVPDDGEAMYQGAATMNQWLVNTMGNNELLRSGQITLHGVPWDDGGALRAGDYAVNTRTGEACYTQGLSLEWTEGSLSTVLTLVRAQAGNLEDPRQRPTPQPRHTISPLTAPSRVPRRAGRARGL